MGAIQLMLLLLLFNFSSPLSFAHIANNFYSGKLRIDEASASVSRDDNGAVSKLPILVQAVVVVGTRLEATMEMVVSLSPPGEEGVGGSYQYMLRQEPMLSPTVNAMLATLIAVVEKIGF
ncbi:hypothetical protein L1987_78961 [Smallanthus sonchifolius]|uniref:Uncharacterized protein n=1 Tax=Smallanthus sonchifolius TaxID=185202 RepID=A0ACB8ZF61_9ASTR|nr:hypothetical protein L1987_78961 [Smallanthus sonchifolius]